MNPFPCLATQMDNNQWIVSRWILFQFDPGTWPDDTILIGQTNLNFKFPLDMPKTNTRDGSNSIDFDSIWFDWIVFFPIDWKAKLIFEFVLECSCLVWGQTWLFSVLSASVVQVQFESPHRSCLFIEFMMNPSRSFIRNRIWLIEINSIIDGGWVLVTSQFARLVYITNQ